MSNSISITELVPGDEVWGWMRLGFALKQGRTVHGLIYRYVPDKATRAESGDLTRFVGLVMINNTTTSVITLSVSQLGSRGIATNREQPKAVDIHYSNLQRMRKLGPTVASQYTDNLTFPANFEDAKFKPYRTLIEVRLR